MSICTLGPDFDHDGKVDLAKYVKIVFGQWVAGKTAGGCRNDINSFSTNPQFLLTLHQVYLCYNIMHMGQKLQDGKKVLEMSQLHPHSKSHPVQTIHPTDLGLLPSWISMFGAPAQGFSPSWDHF